MKKTVPLCLLPDRSGRDGGQLRRAPANGSVLEQIPTRLSSKDAKGEFIGFDNDPGVMQNVSVCR